MEKFCVMARNVFFDILKGGAIFFVALGHSVQSLFPSFKTEPLFLMIIMFLLNLPFLFIVI